MPHLRFRNRLPAQRSYSSLSAARRLPSCRAWISTPSGADSGWPSDAARLRNSSRGRFAEVQRGQPAGAVGRDDQPAGAPRSMREAPPIEEAQLLGAVAQDEVALVPSGEESRPSPVRIEPQQVDSPTLLFQPAGEIFEQRGLAAPMRSHDRGAPAEPRELRHQRLPLRRRKPIAFAKDPVHGKGIIAGASHHSSAPAESRDPRVRARTPSAPRFRPPPAPPPRSAR